jgi:tetratricopeptide (TPR) repeat protein/CHAT domain-containing protein
MPWISFGSSAEPLLAQARPHRRIDSAAHNPARTRRIAVMQKASIRANIAAFLVVLFLGPAAWLGADAFSDAAKQGESSFQTGNYEAAKQSFLEAAKSPDAEAASIACVNVGICLARLGDLDQAIAWFERAASLDGKDRVAFEALAGTCFGDKKNYEKGFRYASEAEKLYSSDPSVYYNLACYFGTKGDAASALKYLELSLFYGFDDYALLSSEADFASVRAKAPFKAFQQNIASIQKAISLRAQALDMQNKGDYAGSQRTILLAIDSLQAALGKGSLAEAALLDYSGTVFWSQKKNDQALSAFQRTLAVEREKLGESHPRTADLYIQIGMTQYLQSRFDDAIASYRKALSIQLPALGEASDEVIGTYNDLGGAYSAKGEHAKAAEYFQKALPAIDSGTAEGAAQKAAVATRLGSALMLDKEYQQAVAAYKAALAAQVAVLGPDHPDVADSYLSMGNVFKLMGDFDSAESCYTQALNIRRKAFGAENEKTIAASELLGDVYYARSDFGKALERYAGDLESIKKSSGADSAQAAQCYMRLAGVEYSLGEYERSGAHYDVARAILAKSFGADYSEVGHCLMGSAAIAYTQGRYPAAADYYSKALSILRKSGTEDDIFVANDYLGLGLASYSLGEYSKAIAYYEKAILIQIKISGDHSPDLSRSYMNLSVAYEALRDTNNAIASIQKCRQIQLEIFGPEHLDLSVAYKIEAGILIDQGDFNGAVDRYNKALEIQTRLLGHDHQQVAETLNNLGTAYQGQKQYDKAIEAYQDSLAIKERVFGKNSPLLALDYLNIGSAYRGKGDVGKALGSMQQGQAIARKNADRALGIQVSQNLADLYFDLKRYPDAKNALQEGIDIVEKARGEVGAGKAEFMARNLGLYYSSIKASAAQKKLDEAFAAAESLKARGYLDRLSLGKALNAFGVADKDRKRMLELNGQLDKLASVQSGEIEKPADVQDKKTLVSVAGQIETRQAEFDALDRSLMSIPRYRELRRPEIAKLNDAQKTLGADEAFIDYILQGDGTSWFAVCLVIKRDSASFIELDPAFDYAKAVLELRAAIQGKSKDRDAIGGRLYGALIKPLEPALAGVSKLIIIPDDIAALAPFDALRKDGNSPYLCQRYRISLAPSVSVLLMTAGRRYGARKGEWLGLGGVKYSGEAGTEGADGRGIAVTDAATEKTKGYYAAQGPKAYFDALGLEWRDLPGTETEVRTIAQSDFAGKGVRLLVGDQASAANVKKLSESGELAQEKIVHFACHAFFDDGYPQYSALVLYEAGAGASDASGETGYLTVEDVALLRFNADLVALSACETGQGGGWLGDGLVGFTRSLLVAGANRAEVTLWPIDDAATRDFMIRWYGLIKSQGMDYSDALAQVKREFIKSGVYSDPLYWSGFVLYGR